jgi:O-antigen/teichoic acid export membrane protein
LLVVITTALRNGSLVPLIAAAVLTPLLASAANLLGLRRSLPDAPSTLPPGVGQHYAARIRREGLSFFLLQLSAALAYSTDLPLISALRGPAEAGMYSLAQRLFSIVPMTLALVWAPLWPIYRQALASGDYPWANRTFKRSAWMAGLYASVAGMTLALAYLPITAIWLHHPVRPSTWLLTGLALACVMDAIGTATATFLNAASILRFQLMLAIPFAIVTVSLKIYALTRVGSEALPWITLTSYFSLVLLPLAIRAPAIRESIVRSDY